MDAKIEKIGDSISIDVRSLQSENIVPEYQIEISVDGNEYQIVSDYSEKTNYDIFISESENLKVRITARNSENMGADKAYQEYEIN